MKPGDSVMLAASRGGRKAAIYDQPIVITSDMKFVPYPEGYIDAGDVGIVLETSQTPQSSFTKVLVGSAVGWLESSHVESC